MKYSRKTRYYYISFIGEIDGIELKVFLIRKGKRGAWHTIISTDKKLSFNQMIMAIIINILTVLENLGVAFDYEITISKLINYKEFVTKENTSAENPISMNLTA